ncbi:unnamed protein product [Owenia fusiformis]|uniref:Uncharacterized protein n=1 Tax=Owenia fusiformis TaxID=6347 RepID=A0A8S4PYS7_OWEFU|nr:unnamed protein product [Owenia fusiformis]
MTDIPGVQNLQQRRKTPLENPPSGVADTGGSTTDPITQKPLPPWFKEQPFQYNARVIVPFLPCFCIVLALAGELLLTMIVVGALVLHILDNMEEKSKAIAFFVVLLMCCQMTVMYSAAPLIWSSLFNVLLIVLLNMFTVLTGGWALIQFPAFIRQEPMVVKVVELMLFAVYPFGCTLLLSWATASVIMVEAAPYCIIIYGFVLLQLFMTPTISSFCKTDSQNAETTLILDPMIVGILSLVYATMPTMVYVVITLILDFRTLFYASTIIHGLFIAGLSVFLSSLLHIKSFLEASGIEEKYIKYIRWCAAVVCLSLLGPVLLYQGTPSEVLHLMPLAAALHTIYGYVAGRKNNDIPLVVMVVVMTIFYIYLFSILPWQLNQYLNDNVGGVQYIHMVMCISVLLCVLAVIVAVVAEPELFGIVITFQSFSMVMCEKFLLAAGVYSPTLLTIILVFAAYFLIRLFHANKIYEKDALMSLSLHLTKVPDIIDAVVDNKDVSTASFTYRLFSTLILAAIVSRVVVFENRDVIPNIQALMYFVALGVSIMFNTFSILPEIWWFVMRDFPSLIDVIALGFTIWGLLFLKLSYCHVIPGNDTKQLSPMLLCYGVLMMLIHPPLEYTWEATQKWLILLSITISLPTLPIIRTIRHPLPLFGLTAVAGFPVGFFVTDIIYSLLKDGSGVGVLANMFIGLNLTTVFFLTASLYQIDHITTVLRKRLYFILTTLGICSVVLFIHDATFLDLRTEHGSLKMEFIDIPASKMALLNTLVAAAGLKLFSIKNKPSNLPKTAGGVPYIDRKLPLLGNACAVIAYLLACQACPIQQWEFWYCGCTLLLLLLQKDHYLLHILSPSNQAAPAVSMTTLMLLFTTLISNQLWTTESGYTMFRGIVEIIIEIIALPNLLTFLYLFWKDSTNTLDGLEQIAVFTMPLNGLLFLFGTSYNSWVLAGISLVCGIWTTMIRIPHLRNTI